MALYHHRPAHTHLRTYNSPYLNRHQEVQVHLACPICRQTSWLFSKSKDKVQRRSRPRLPLLHHQVCLLTHIACPLRQPFPVCRLCLLTGNKDMHSLWLT